jgi:heat-inducible transcriptional repressor
LILITNSGRIQQHVVELAGEISAATLAAVQNRLNSDLVGKPLSAVAGLIKAVEATLEPELSSQLMPLFQTLNSQIDANSQEKLLLAGTSNLVRSGQDFDGGITGVLDAIEEQVVLLKLISEMSTETDGVSLRIGKETGLDSFSSASAVFSGYENQGAEIAKIGVIGPTRMDYAQNIAAVTAIARYLTRALGN